MTRNGAATLLGIIVLAAVLIATPQPCAAAANASAPSSAKARSGPRRQGCCKPKIRSISYRNQGSIRLIVKFRSLVYLHVIYVDDAHGRQMVLKHSPQRRRERILLENAVDCGAAPHEVTIWCMDHRSCRTTRDVQGTCR